MMMNETVIVGALLCAIGFSMVGILGLLLILMIAIKYCCFWYYDHNEREKILALLNDVLTSTDVSFPEAHTVTEFLYDSIRHPERNLTIQQMTSRLLKLKSRKQETRK